jgi:hypothetical protein
LQVTVDDDIVMAADVRVGLMHRSAEKLFEARDYRQAMLLANRHDWLSAFTSELGVALTLESALGVTPPERATWIRTLMAEANRMAASLAFLAPVAGEMRGALEILRERFADIQEHVSGGRVHPGFARIGGVAFPIDDAGLTLFERWTADIDEVADAVRDAITDYAEPLVGVAAISRDDAIALGLSGTVGRASGVRLDLRRDAPYLAYSTLQDGETKLCITRGNLASSELFAQAVGIDGGVAAVGEWGFAIQDGDEVALFSFFGDMTQLGVGRILGSEPTGWLAVDSDEGLALLNVDGSSRLVAPNERSLDATFSPDGTLIAGLSGEGLTVFSLDEGTEVAVTSERPGMPQVVWSSDSRYALYPGLRGVVVLDTSDGTVRELMPTDIVTGLGLFDFDGQ